MTVPARPTAACPLLQAQSHLATLRTSVFLALSMPVVLSVASVAVVRLFDPRYLSNPIVMTVLGLFLVGQVVLLFQLRRLFLRVKSGLRVLAILKQAGKLPDLQLLEERLLALPPDPMGNLVLGWIELGRDFAGEGSSDLLQNSIDRRSLHDHTELGVHTLINRVVLKVGFLGTLIGLLMTFPPMKRAVLGLSTSGGELTFIRDIAKAIDEDAYAIQATLVATGFSLLLETLVVQVMERFYGRFELVESLLSDWNLTVLRRSMAPRTATGSEEGNLHLKATLAQGQRILDAHLKQLIESLRQTGESVEAVAATQAALHKRVIELSQWENEYRQFLSSKLGAAAPASCKAEA